ncbi:FAD binding domain [Cordyceps militaris]|uniref:FAD binding domain n=1 Tax=Cordyceps militaris TaxID=73501 RepID=A0A2H4SDW4_CORMI|nr:FAD binding domain [Cordyceps militaris]
MANTKELKKALGDIPVFLIGDDGYDEHIATWNTYTDRKPIGVAIPKSTAEVARVVQAIRRAGIPRVTVRGGGHSFEALGLGGADGAFIIDTVQLDTLTSDPARDTITAGGGCLLGQVALYAWQHGRKMLPMGTCPTVGLAGQIQCGGYGFYTRTYGTLTDRVLSVEVVTPDGRVRTASDKENADLFFAIRGAGTGSFGVITSVTLRTNDAPVEGVAVFSLRWSLDRQDIPDILKKLHDASVASPLTVNPMVIIWLGVLEIAGVILEDSAAKLDATWKALTDTLPAADTSSLTPRDLIDTVADIGTTQTSAPWYADLRDLKREGSEHKRFMKIKAGFVPTLLPDDFLAKLAAFGQTQPRSGVRVQLLGLDPERIPSPDTTSIKVRGCPWLMGMSVWLPVAEYGAETEAEAKRRLPWLNQAYELFYPLTKGGYLGDDDYDEANHGRDMMASFYGEHLDKLQVIKAKYDPSRLFSHPLSV